jgi:hypothetical protein
MQPMKTLGTSQMKLLFCDSKPMVLPQGKQRELTEALVDLLLSAVVEPRTTESEEKQ